MRSGGGVLGGWADGRTRATRRPIPCPTEDRQRRNGGGATPVHFSISLSPALHRSVDDGRGRSVFLPSLSCARIRHAVMSGAGCHSELRPLRSLHISNRRTDGRGRRSLFLLFFPRKSFGCLLWSHSSSSTTQRTGAPLFVLISLSHFLLPFLPLFLCITSSD